MAVEGAGLGVGAVARRLGVSPSTLRTWGRRYGIGPSRHSAGGHRRYDATDVARLELMNRLIRDGVPPGEAARVARAADLSAPATAAPRRSGTPRPAWGAGGNRIAVPGATTATRALVRAATALDTTTTRRLIDEAIAADGVVTAWQDLLAPVLTGLGARHAATGTIIEVEHLLSSCAQAVLDAAIATAQAPLPTRPVLLACAPEEQHTLPVLALGAALARDRIAVCPLGARVPYAALEAAVRRLAPSVIFVWSQTAETGDPAPLADLPRGRPPARVLVGGPGWAVDRLPERVRRVTSLPDALAEVHALV
jgi:MerR family transcriptional regulator, light-induced transcriptional regulator